MKGLSNGRILGLGFAAGALALFGTTCGLGTSRLNMETIQFSSNVAASSVAPTFEKYCVTCHKPGGIAPFALTTYDEIYARRGQIVAAMESRRMPPWGVQPSSECRETLHNYSVPQQEIDRVKFWVASGAPQGPPIPPLQGQQTLDIDTPDVVATPSAPYTPTFPGGLDEYPCRLHKGYSAGGYIDEQMFAPGNKAINHHAIVKLLRDPALIADFDLKYSQGGTVDCWAIPGIADPTKYETIDIWSAGGPKIEFTSYQAKPELPAGPVRIVVESHYSKSTAGSLPVGSDFSSIKFKFAPPAPPGTYSPVVLGGNVASFPLVGEPAFLGLPANTPNISLPTASFDSPLPLNSTRVVLGVMLHMHRFGRSGKIEIYRANGTKECLLDIPRYDFNWQWTYMLKRPEVLWEGDQIGTTFGYDTSGHMTPVSLSEQTDGEMGFTFFRMAQLF